MGSDKGFGTACSCRLYFVQHRKKLILLESSAPLSNQVEIGQQVQEVLGSLTHLCTNTPTPRFARALFPKGNELKTHAEGGRSPAPERLGSRDFGTGDPRTHSSVPALPCAAAVTHRDCPRRVPLRAALRRACGGRCSLPRPDTGSHLHGAHTCALRDSRCRGPGCSSTGGTVMNTALAQRRLLLSVSF